MTRTASWLLDSKVRSSAGQPRQASRTETSATASARATKAIRIADSCSGLCGREDQGDEQDRAELAGAAGRQQVGAEAGLQLAVVAQDRDQGADRGRRHRRAGVEEGDDDPGRGEDAADPVGERRPRAAQPEAPSFIGRPLIRSKSIS